VLSGIKIVSDNQVALLVRQAGFDGEEFDSMRADFQKSGEPSINGFLETRDDYLEIGRTAIAAALLPRERREPTQGNWYPELLRWIRPPTLAGYAANQLAVITFNYDRSLEFRIAQSILGRFGARSERAGRLHSGVEYCSRTRHPWFSS